jgi:hypothetical protein
MVQEQLLLRADYNMANKNYFDDQCMILIVLSEI